MFKNSSLISNKMPKIKCNGNEKEELTTPFVCSLTILETK